MFFPSSKYNLPFKPENLYIHNKFRFIAQELLKIQQKETPEFPSNFSTNLISSRFVTFNYFFILIGE